jgi:hypothetical protein
LTIPTEKVEYGGNTEIGPMPTSAAANVSHLLLLAGACCMVLLVCASMMPRAEFGPDARMMAFGQFSGTAAASGAKDESRVPVRP